jgi:flagellar assembly protein FliH
MKPSSTDPLVPRPRASGDATGLPQAAAGATAGGATAGSANGAGSTNGADGVRVVRFDRPLRTGTDTLGWADPRIRQRIDQVAAQAREEAYSLGYARGWAQGRTAAAEREEAERVERAATAAQELREQAARAQALLGTLTEAARQAALSAVPAWTEVADAVADGGLAIARAALGRELAAVDAEVADAVRTALNTLAGANEVTVHVHPGDLGLLRDLVGGQLPGHVRLAADPGIPPGCVLAQTPVQRLRRDLPAAVARAEEVLRS